MKHMLGLFAVLLVSTAPSLAQSINIDLGLPGAPRPPATYEVLTYAWMPTAPATPNRVHIDTNPTTTTVGAAWPGAQTENVTYARHFVDVTAGNRWLRPHSGVPSGGNYTVGAALNGIQI